MSLTKKAFDKFRSDIGQSRLPPQDLIANDDQVKQMHCSDGLQYWKDGPNSAPNSSTPPSLSDCQIEAKYLWVVRKEDVVHAKENCPFGLNLKSNVIKHTNLTGGKAAYSGGELLFLDEGIIVLNGCSGRYGPHSKIELDQVVQAFVRSGYGVWSMGFDEETNRPAHFGGIFPKWVE
ncbi:MAG: hypothetical protein ACRDD3_02140 [Azovibrio sp.]